MSKEKENTVIYSNSPETLECATSRTPHLSSIDRRYLTEKTHTRTHYSPETDRPCFQTQSETERPKRVSGLSVCISLGTVYGHVSSRVHVYRGVRVAGYVKSRRELIIFYTRSRGRAKTWSAVLKGPPPPLTKIEMGNTALCYDETILPLH